MNTVIARARGTRINPAAGTPEPAGSPRGLRPLAMTVCEFGLFSLTACASPEAERTRGGGPGADVKNWGQPVELHAGAEPYNDTPCATEPVKCKGPVPVFGSTPPPD
jgi:hypothetical protein